MLGWVLLFVGLGSLLTYEAYVKRYWRCYGSELLAALIGVSVLYALFYVLLCLCAHGDTCNKTYSVVSINKVNEHNYGYHYYKIRYEKDNDTLTCLMRSDFIRFCTTNVSDKFLTQSITKREYKKSIWYFTPKTRIDTTTYLEIPLGSLK